MRCDVNFDVCNEIYYVFTDGICKKKNDAVNEMKQGIVCIFTYLCGLCHLPHLWSNISDMNTYSIYFQAKNSACPLSIDM